MVALRRRIPASSRCRVIFRSLFFPCVLFAPVPAMATETVTMDMASQAIDLDSGAVTEATSTVPASGADVKLAYNADRAPHAVVFPVGQQVEIAFVAGVGYDGLTPPDIATLTFSAEPVDLPFSANDCIVVRTDQGTFFKLGNAAESGLSITFNYEQL